MLELLKSGFITIGHAKVVLGLPTPELQEEAAQMIADNQLNVRQARSFVQKAGKARKRACGRAAAECVAGGVEESLKQALGSEVRVAYHDGKGKLTVHFYSDDQLKAFANLLGQYSVGVTSQSRYRSTALLSQFSKIVPIKMAYLRYAVADVACALKTQLL